MTTETCTYHTVTLQAGEQFNLPPGATLIGASDPGAITSVNNCAPVDNLETPTCYGFLLVLHEESASGSETFTRPDTFCHGITVGNIYYPFASVVNTDNPTDIQTQMEALSIGSIFTGFCTSSNSDGGRDSVKYYLMFNTLPSIGDNLEINGVTDAPNSGSGVPVAPFSFAAQTRDKIVADGHTGVCNCSALT